MDKNTGLLIILLIGIFLVWSFVMQMISPPPPPEEQIDKEQAPPKEETIEKKAEITAVPLEEELIEKNDIRLNLEFDNYNIIFSNKGGVVRSIKLKNTNIDYILKKIEEC